MQSTTCQFSNPQRYRFKIQLVHVTRSWLVWSFNVLRSLRIAWKDQFPSQVAFCFTTCEHGLCCTNIIHTNTKTKMDNYELSNEYISHQMNIEIRPWDHGERLEVSVGACGAQLSTSDRTLEEPDRTAEDCDGHGSRLSTVHLSDKTADTLSSLRYSARSYTITYHKVKSFLVSLFPFPSARHQYSGYHNCHANVLCCSFIFHRINLSLIQTAYQKLWIALSTVM